MLSLFCYLAGMVKSLFSRLVGKAKRKTDELPTPDISRVFGASARPGDHAADADAAAPQGIETVDVDLWLRADLQRLEESWQAVQADTNAGEAREKLRRAVHNLLGASGAYGGGALTRLASSLHKLVGRDDDLSDDAALINLHIQACRAAGLAPSRAGDEVADAVCEALEARVDQSLANCA